MACDLVFLHRFHGFFGFAERQSPSKKYFSKILQKLKKKCIFAALEPAKPLYDAQMCGSFFFNLKTTCYDEDKQTIQQNVQHANRTCKALAIKRFIH